MALVHFFIFYSHPTIDIVGALEECVSAFSTCEPVTCGARMELEPQMQAGVDCSWE